MTTGSIRIAMTSDVGLRRKNNQDTGFAQQGVFMVCDGMGGGKGGEQASQLAAQHFAQLAAMPSRTRQDIDDTLARAQHDILDLGDRLGGVAGTTCSGLVLPQDHADSASARSAALFSDADDQDFSDQTYVVNVGDSRTYHLSPLAHADAPATDIIPAVGRRFADPHHARPFPAPRSHRFRADVAGRGGGDHSTQHHHPMSG